MTANNQPQAKQYALPADADLEKIISALSNRFNLAAEPERVLESTYFDSFDWRLYLAGGLLHEEQEEDARRLVWNAVDEGTPPVTYPLQAETPSFAWDLPQSPLRARLQPLLEMRALLPQVQVRVSRRTFRVLDEEEKTVLRLLFESSEARPPVGDEAHALTSRIRLLPVRGYPEPMAEMREALQALRLKAPAQNLLEEALAALGRQPADYSSKLDFHFDPATRADQVAKAIHLHLLHIIELNIAGTKADLDSEFLHDLRVAVRRTRSALSQVKGVFDDAVVQQQKERFGWLGQVTGPTRDMHVYLLEFEDYRNALPERFRADLDPLHLFLEEHQKSAHKQLVKDLNSARFRTLLKEWRKFLETPPPVRPTAPNAALPIGEVASQRIWKSYKKVMKDGNSLTPESPAEHLHELRKDCKKLRYLIEFFASIYPDAKIKPLIKTIKRLLDALGDFQDLEVQADKLRDLAHQMVEEGKVPADTLLAMGMLVDGLLRRQQAARGDFDERFAEFSERKIQHLFKSLFSPAARSDENPEHL